MSIAHTGSAEQPSREPADVAADRLTGEATSSILPQRRAVGSRGWSGMEGCRFVSSWGGVARCADPGYRHGFCRFHFDCYMRGEITERGLISEKLDDQERRRAINFHALPAGIGRTA